MKPERSPEELAIEQAAIVKFVADAKTATPEQRAMVVRKLSRFAAPESAWGERPTFRTAEGGAQKMSVESVAEALRQVKAL